MTLSVEEKIIIQMRRKRIKNIDIARHLGLSAPYVSRLIDGREYGPAANKNLEAVKKFVGLK